MRIVVIKMIFFLSTCFLYSDESFINNEKINLSYFNFTKDYCKQLDKENKFCVNETLRYFDYNDKNLSIKGVDKYIKPFIKSYEHVDIKNEFLLGVADYGKLPSEDWDHDVFIDLFAKTSATYTLSIDTGGYSGGAHPYYHREFINIDMKTQKKLNLKNLFIKGFEKELLKIALLEYRSTYNLDINQSLSSEGWSEEKFVLAKNFAITKKGIYFFYNQYEIKSYADASTEFIIPYTKLKNIINYKGVLANSLKQKE